MRLPALALMALCIAPSAARGAGSADARPKDTAFVGTVTARRGSYAVVAVAEGAKAQMGVELLVGRPALLVAVAKGKKKIEAWGHWQEAGRIKLLAQAAPGFHLALIVHDNPLTGPGGERAPSIRPGDLVYRAGK